MNDMSRFPVQANFECKDSSNSENLSSVKSIIVSYRTQLTNKKKHQKYFKLLFKLSYIIFYFKIIKKHFNY